MDIDEILEARSAAIDLAIAESHPSPEYVEEQLADHREAIKDIFAFQDVDPVHVSEQYLKGELRKIESFQLYDQGTPQKLLYDGVVGLLEELLSHKPLYWI